MNQINVQTQNVTISVENNVSNINVDNVIFNVTSDNNVSLIYVDGLVSGVDVTKQTVTVFDDYVIPDFVTNLDAVNAGFDKFDLWRSPDNKINIVKYQDFFTGFNVNLSRALSYFRRMF